jgi:hypothetical protein
MLKTNFYKISRIRYNYEYNEFDDFDIWLLYNLFDDFSSPSDAFPFLIEELSKKNSRLLAGNLSILDLEESTVDLYSRWDDEKRVLKINRAYLLELANKWCELFEKGVPIITIKRDGETFIIEEGKEE